MKAYLKLLFKSPTLNHFRSIIFISLKRALKRYSTLFYISEATWGVGRIFKNYYILKGESENLYKIVKIFGFSVSLV